METKIVLYTLNLANGSYPNCYLSLVQNIKEQRIKSGHRSLLVGEIIRHNSYF